MTFPAACVRVCMCLGGVHRPTRVLITTCNLVKRISILRCDLSLTVREVPLNVFFFFFLTTTCSCVFYLTRVYEDRVRHWRNTQRRFVCATIRQPTTEAWWMTFNKRSHSTVNNFKLNTNLLLKHNFVRFGTDTVENFYLNQVSLLWFWTIPDIPPF